MRNKKGQFIDGRGGINTRFTREGSLGNQYAKGNPKNATTFGVIDNRMEKHKQWKGGKYKCRDGNMITYASKKRMGLARWNWIQVNGEIPRGYVIIHLDGDKFNDEIHNLDCISRADNLKRNMSIVL
jgi:hypothetical protein